jgi:hypothetical protein
MPRYCQLRLVLPASPRFPDELSMHIARTSLFRSSRTIKRSDYTRCKFSTNVSQDASKIRNMALVAHVGKCSRLPSRLHSMFAQFQERPH